MDSPPDVATIVAGMVSENESHRKLAAFHLQTLLSDPEFADTFVQGDGLPVLRRIILEDKSNTLAYALGSLNRLLEQDLGWDEVGSEVIGRAVEVIVARPLINVLRNALHLLVLVVGKPLRSDETNSRPGTAHSSSRPDTGTSSHSHGFRALKPLLRDHEEFLDCLVDKLSSADHALCGNALRLINALLRDSVVNGGENDWPRFLRRLQELGIIDGVENLMRGDAVRDLAGPILEFQRLYKVLLRRWRNVAVDMERGEHRKALTRIYATSYPPGFKRRGSSRVELALRAKSDPDTADASSMWARLGFQSENPAEDFEDAGFLGLMDLVAFVRRDTDAYQKILLEQGVQQTDQRCPVAKASLRITAIMYQHYDVEEEGRLSTVPAGPFEDEHLEWVVQPLILRWDRVHSAALSAFLRLWTAAGADVHEFEKIDDLARILISRVLGDIGRRATAEEAEAKLNSATLQSVRKWQLEDLDAVFERGWGADLRIARERLHKEAVQFMQEQRIRCLLTGAWFPSISTTTNTSRPESPSSLTGPTTTITSWRFVQLSPSRRHVHHSTHAKKPDTDPSISEMPQRIDVNNISSVVSNVRSSDMPSTGPNDDTKTKANGTSTPSATITQLTIHGSSNGPRLTPRPESERPLLELQTTDSTLASEWLDGLLMLLDQQPITAETHKMIHAIEDWGLKVRMLSLEWDDVEWGNGDDLLEKRISEAVSSASVQEVYRGHQRGYVPPSREGVDRDYWYDMGIKD
ncbi:hypothetical protein MBLNU457_g0721t1 [Dothideomycetes sp. NU457]